MRKTEYKASFRDAKRILRSGGCGVVLTDTIYGIVGQALGKETVARIYRIKGRDQKKPFLILISSLKQLLLFGINLEKGERKILKEYWPGRVSVVLSCAHKEFHYLHRGGKSLAFRLPNNSELLKLIRETGPLVAPSANPEGQNPARNLREAREYFGDKIDFYLPSRRKPLNKPSKIIEITQNKVKVIRK